jgi:hypothetical protein
MTITMPRIVVGGQQLSNRCCRSLSTTTAAATFDNIQFSNEDNSRNRHVYHIQQKCFNTVSSYPLNKHFNTSPRLLSLQASKWSQISLSKRTLVSSTKSLLDYPSHQVVGLPSLSPVRSIDRYCLVDLLCLLVLS